MNVDRRRQVEELFQNAVDLPVEERLTFLDVLCATDSALRGSSFPGPSMDSHRSSDGS